MTSASLSDQIKATTRLERELLVPFLRSALKYYEESWQEIGDDTGLFGEYDPSMFNMRSLQFSSPVIEYVVRPHAQILVALAAVIQGDNGPGTEEEERSRRIHMLNCGVRWMCRTHLTGDLDVETFLSRRRWGENWNSSLWASALAMTCQFAEAALDPDLQEAVRLVVAFEANRFVETLPPNGRRGDSKAEETVKDAMVIAWAMAMMPDHPAWAEWEHTFKTYALNVASTAYDHGDFSDLDGHAVNSYITTVTMHPDFTLESHGFFHPDFLTYTQWLTAASLAFQVSDREPPAYLLRHAHDRAAEHFMNCCISNGYPWPIGGQDWPLWILKPYSFAYSMARGDRIALKTLLHLLSLLADFQEKSGDGRFIPGLPKTRGGWGLSYESQIGFELALLYFTKFPDDLIVPSAGRFEKAQEATEIFPYVQTMIGRNGKVLRSFTWNNLLGLPCGFVVPQSKPFLVGGVPDSLVGKLELNGVKAVPKVLHHQETVRDGFETSGEMLYLDPYGTKLLAREMRVYTWSEDGILLFDRLTALCDLTVESEEACPLYIVNDDITNNAINIVSGSLEESYTNPSDQDGDHVMPNEWVVTEDLLLYQLFWGMEKGILYHKSSDRAQPPYWKNARMDRIFIRGPRGKFEGGQVIREFGLYVGLGKGPRRFKVNGEPGRFFKGLILIDNRNTFAL